MKVQGTELESMSDLKFMFELYTAEPALPKKMQKPPTSFKKLIFKASGTETK